MNSIQSFFKTILKIIASIEDVICAIGVWATTILIFLAVINRYFLHFPIMWLNDFALYCFIFFMLITAALTTRERGHTAVDVFHQKVFAENSKANHMYTIFLDILSIFIVLFFLPVARKFMISAMKYPEYATLVRWFNTSWLRMTLFFSFVLIFIHLIVILVEDIAKLRSIYLKNRGYH